MLVQISGPPSKIFVVAKLSFLSYSYLFAGYEDARLYCSRCVFSIVLNILWHCDLLKLLPIEETGVGLGYGGIQAVEVS